MLSPEFYCTGSGRDESPLPRVLALRIMAFQFLVMLSIFLSIREVLHPCRVYDHGVAWKGNSQILITSSMRVMSAASSRSLISCITALVFSQLISLAAVIIGTTVSKMKELSGMTSK